MYACIKFKKMTRSPKVVSVGIITFFFSLGKLESSPDWRSSSAGFLHTDNS